MQHFLNCIPCITKRFIDINYTDKIFASPELKKPNELVLLAAFRQARKHNLITKSEPRLHSRSHANMISPAEKPTACDA